LSIYFIAPLSEIRSCFFPKIATFCPAYFLTLAATIHISVCVRCLWRQNGVDTTTTVSAAHETLLRNRKNAWVQLAGHPGETKPCDFIAT